MQDEMIEQVSETVQAHCARHGIRIKHLQTGAVRFTGPEVDMIFNDPSAASVKALQPYRPTKQLALRRML
jgi:hypothetical protein